MLNEQDQIKLINDISDKILNFNRNTTGLSNSDKQAVAEGMVIDIINSIY